MLGTGIAKPVLHALDAQSDQTPAAESTTPKKKAKSKSETRTKTKKTKPADTTAPAANPPAAPKQ